MYLIFNREYKLVGESSNLMQLKKVIGEDYNQEYVDSLQFIRGKTVVSEENLKNILHKLVKLEQDKVLEYVTSDIEGREDESVELKTDNRNLRKELDETRGYLRSVSGQLGKVIGLTEELDGLDTKPTETSVFDGESEESVPEELDTETQEVLEHIERNKRNGYDRGRQNSQRKSVSKVIPDKRKRVVPDIDFISVIKNKKVVQINNLFGQKLIKTSKLAEDVGLDREHIEYFMGTTLRECGGEPKFNNKSVVSPAEAVWVILSAVTKREGYGENQHFQKTKANAEDFYDFWEKQKDGIEELFM